MRIYGAGSLDDIKACSDLGVTGILTNPQGFDQYYRGEMTLEEITVAIAETTDLPAFIQIHGPTTEVLVERARKLNAIAPDRIGFKVIADPKGFRAIRVLQLEGIDCIATALFSVAQASIASTVGAFGICPFVSRARSIGLDPHVIISDIRAGYDRLIAVGIDAPEIIAVSLHGVEDVELSIRAGADAVAMRYPLIEEMMKHSLSDKAEALFAKNWANVRDEDVSYLRTDVSGDAE